MHFYEVRGAAISAAADLIRVYDDAGNVIETHAHKGEFIEP
jgi:hypothetical protein